MSEQPDTSPTTADTMHPGDARGTDYGDPGGLDEATEETVETSDDDELED